MHNSSEKHVSMGGSNTLLPAVQRPKMANEALELLEDGIQIEVKNDKVFDLLRYFEKAKRNFRCTCHVNEFTEGWTVIVHGG